MAVKLKIIALSAFAYLAGLIGSAQALEPLPGLTNAERLLFDLGLRQLSADWHPAPSDDVAFDGLGPLFIATSCAACHPDGGAGDAPRAADNIDALLARLSIVFEPPHPRLGHRFQPLSTMEDSEGEADVVWVPTAFEIDDRSIAAARPVITIRPAGETQDVHGYAISGRTAPPLDGLGLIEAIPDDAIRALADPDDENGDGISGRVSAVIVESETRVGRFGWRAEHASLSGQTAFALSRDMGLSTAQFPDHYGDCTEAQTECRAQPHGAGGVSGDTEAPGAVVDQMVDAIRLSAPPAPAEQSGAGFRLFESTGCTACHRPTLPVSDGTAGVTSVQPYSDFLLHDMGSGLAASATGAGDTFSEWRTAPLWGLSNRLRPDNTGLLHDGRAASLEEAILWHGGEAAEAVGNFKSLTPADSAMLIAFLKTL